MKFLKSITKKFSNEQKTKETKCSMETTEDSKKETIKKDSNNKEATPKENVRPRSKEEIKQEERKRDFLKYYVQPHTKVSREATRKDIKRIIGDAHIMYNLCYTDVGTYALRPDMPAHFGVAHPQINNKKPLRFFVTRNKEIIINPKIINHTEHPVERVEGCLSYPHKMPVKVLRYNKVTVEYMTLSKDGKDLVRADTLNLSGIWAQAWQHEIAHLNGKYIYDEDVKPEDAL